MNRHPFPRRSARRRKATVYRLGLYDPCDPAEAVEFIGPRFSGSHADRVTMRQTIDHFNERAATREDVNYCLGVFRQRIRKRYRLALVSVDGAGEFVDFVGRWFDGSAHDRFVMRRTIQLYNEWARTNPDYGLRLAVQRVF